MVEGWRVLKMEPGSNPMILSLDEETEKRFAAGLHGWAKNEGYSVETERPKQAVEALILRDARRASHHLDEVRAIMESITWLGSAGPLLAWNAVRLVLSPVYEAILVEIAPRHTAGHDTEASWTNE